MSDSAGITKKSDKITGKFDSMITKSKSMQAFFVRVIYPMYQQFQITKFDTSNASEGRPWTPPTSNRYLKLKRRVFADYPGAGEKTLIASGVLASASIGRNPLFSGGEPFHRMTATNESLTIQVSTEGRATSKSKKTVSAEYFKYQNEIRPFMKFSKDHISLMKQATKDYIKGLRGTF